MRRGADDPFPPLPRGGSMDIGGLPGRLSFPGFGGLRDSRRKDEKIFSEQVGEQQQFLGIVLAWAGVSGKQGAGPSPPGPIGAWKSVALSARRRLLECRPGVFLLGHTEPANRRQPLDVVGGRAGNRTRDNLIIWKVAILQK